MVRNRWGGTKGLKVNIIKIQIQMLYYTFLHDPRCTEFDINTNFLPFFRRGP